MLTVCIRLLKDNMLHHMKESYMIKEDFLCRLRPAWD